MDKSNFKGRPKGICVFILSGTDIPVKKHAGPTVLGKTLDCGIYKFVI